MPTNSKNHPAVIAQPAWFEAFKKNDRTWYQLLTGQVTELCAKSAAGKDIAAATHTMVTAILSNLRDNTGLYSASLLLYRLLAETGEWENLAKTDDGRYALATLSFIWVEGVADIPDEEHYISLSQKIIEGIGVKNAAFSAEKHCPDRKTTVSMALFGPAWNSLYNNAAPTANDLVDIIWLLRPPFQSNLGPVVEFAAGCTISSDTDQASLPGDVL